MFRITASTSTQAAQSYFKESLVRGDYYFEGVETSGQWGGKSAEALGLSGKIGKEDFLQLVANRRPDGSRLTLRDAANRRPGYDFTFDVPKSVSLLHLLSGDERIVEVMRKSAQATMEELEQEMHTRVRKNGAFEDRPTKNMLWADFTHTTTRPATVPKSQAGVLLKAHPWLKEHCDAKGELQLPDPHLHLHVFALNATFDSQEQCWKAGEFMRIKRDALYYQSAYHVRLAAGLQELGYAIEPTKNAFEIHGVPTSLLELYSRRTTEVEALAQALGITDADRKAQLGAKSRKRKAAARSLGEFQSAWKSLAPRKELEGLKSAHRKALRTEGEVVVDPLKEAASIQFALSTELERASEVSYKRVLGRALAQGVGTVSIEGVTEKLQTNRTVITGRINGEDRLTTEEILVEEAALWQTVREGRGAVVPLISGRYTFTHEFLKARTPTNGEQRAAVESVFGNADWVMGIVGRAGTGKTTLLKEISQGLNQLKVPLILCAPTAEAARGVLREEGFSQADTLQRLLQTPAMHPQLKGAVLWLDEAGLVGNKDLLALFNLAKAQGVKKVILAGDPTQIRSVARGEALRYLEQNSGMTVARLSQVNRQKNPALKATVEAFSCGKVREGFEQLETQGALHQLPEAKAHLWLAEAYSKLTEGKGSNLIICPTHKEGEKLSLAVRKSLRANGHLDREQRSVIQTVNLNFTLPEKQSPQSYTQGMVIQFKQSAPGFRKGERVRVCAVDAKQGWVQVNTNDERVALLPLQYAQRFGVYRLNELAIATGERIRITDNGTTKDGRYRFNNGALFSVVGFTPEGDLKLDNGKALPKNFGHLAYGYVTTADSAQSKTVDCVLASLGEDSLGATDLRRMYVTLSRARHQAIVVTPDKEALMLAAQRASDRLTATEMVEQSSYFDRSVAQRYHQYEAMRNSPRPPVRELATTEVTAPELTAPEVPAPQAPELGFEL